MTSAERRAKLAAAMKAALERRLQTTGSHVSSLAAVYQRAEETLLADLARQLPRSGNWTVHDMARLDNAVAAWHAGLAQELRTLAATTASHAWSAGSALQPRLGREAHQKWGFNRPSVEQAGVAADHLDNLVVRLGDRVRGDIQSQIRMGVLGGKSPSDVMANISRMLGTPDRAYIGPLWRQAETVWRTEAMNIFNMANWQRIRELGESMPGVRKRWSHDGRPKTPREYHLTVLHGQTIPWNEKFQDVDRKGNVWLVDGPHDPVAPAELVINCGCAAHAVTWTEDDEEGLMDAALARQGAYQLDWVQQNRPDLLSTPEGIDWLRRFRPAALRAARTSGGLFGGGS